MEKIEIVDRLLAALDAGERAELVIVMGTKGSSPRSAGAWMAVFADGSSAGTVGGGRVEDIAQREASGLLAAGQSRTVSYTMGGASSDTGMICGGLITLCYLHVTATLAPVLASVRDVLAAHGEGVLALDLSPLGAQPGAAVHGAESARTVDGPLPLAVEHPADQDGIVAGVVGERYREPICPEGFTYIFGCGHVGRALTAALSAAGFAVIACDDRPEMLGAELLPGALERRLVDYDDLAATCAIGRRDFVVSATAGHGSDYEVISQALAAHPSYVGCLGSKRKTGFVRDRLIADGFSVQDAERLHMPIGLPIHAETPAEIAVSIVAQMIEHRRTVLV